LNQQAKWLNIFCSGPGHPKKTRCNKCFTRHLSPYTSFTLSDCTSHYFVFRAHHFGVTAAADDIIEHVLRKREYTAGY